MGHRTKAVMVRLTEEEHERLSAAAERNGATLAGYLRMVSCSDIEVPRVNIASKYDWLDSMLRLLNADLKQQELLLAHTDTSPDLVASFANLVNDLPDKVRLAAAIAANPNVPTEALRTMWEAHSQTVWDGYDEQAYEESVKILAIIAGAVGDPLNVRHYLYGNFMNFASYVEHCGAPCSRCRFVMTSDNGTRNVGDVLDEHQEWCNHQTRPEPGL